MEWTGSTVVGVDEAGYGCLAGPVSVGLVVLPDGLDPAVLPVRDSKRLKTFQHGPIAEAVKAQALAYAVVFIHPAAIDRPGAADGKPESPSCLLSSKMTGIRLGVEVLHNMRSPRDLPPGFEVVALKCLPFGVELDLLYMDGNYFDPPIPWLPHACLTKGDDKISAIAAAANLAKHVRDTYMAALADTYPVLKEYDVHTRVGYWTKPQEEAIRDKGFTAIHRRSYKTCRGAAPRRGIGPMDGLDGDWQAWEP